MYKCAAFSDGRVEGACSKTIKILRFAKLSCFTSKTLLCKKCATNENIIIKLLATDCGFEKLQILNSNEINVASLFLFLWNLWQKFYQNCSNLVVSDSAPLDVKQPVDMGIPVHLRRVSSPLPLRCAPEALQSVERSNKHDVKKMPITHTVAKLRDEAAPSSRARGAAHNPLLLQIQHLLWFIYKYIDFTAILVENINNYDLISKFFIEVPVLPLSASKNISAGSGTFSIPQYIYARINWHQTFHGQTILEIAKEKCGNPKILELIVKHFPDDMVRISDKIQIKNSFFVNKKDASTQTDPVEQETVPVTPSYLIFQKMESIPPARADAFDPVESRTARLRDETPPPPYFL